MSKMYFSTKFRFISSNCALVISIKLKAKEIFLNVPIFYFAANEHNFINIANISKVYLLYIILGPKIM